MVAKNIRKKRVPAQNTRVKSPTAKKTVPKATGTYSYGVGRRKRATVRAKLYQHPTDLIITVDGTPYKEYFPALYQKLLDALLEKTAMKTGIIELYARGGGISAQAEASRLAISHAIVQNDAGMRPLLRAFGYLTTDIRKVLPKRSGLKKARKREQWSKR